MANLLIQEPPLQVLPSLAVSIGLEEAIFLQQLHYLMNISTNERDGRRWVYNTAKQWQEDHFPWASDQTVRRVFKSLRDRGLVIATSEYNDKKMDKKLWYAIDYEALESLEMPALKTIIPFVKNDEPISNNRRSNIQETTQETTTRETQTPVGSSDTTTANPKELVEAVCYGQERDPATITTKGWWAKQITLAKKIAERGYNRYDVLECTSWLTGERWVNGFFDLVLVNSQIDKWDVAGRPKRKGGQADSGRKIINGELRTTGAARKLNL